MATLLRGLLVEDDPQAPLLKMLELPPDDPLEIEHEQRLDACIDRLEAGLFDVLILDLDLPDAEVVDATSAIVRRIPAIPVVVITRHEDPSLDREVLRQGAQDSLCRQNLRPEALQRALRTAVERHRQGSDLRERLGELERFHGTVVHEMRASLARASALLSWAKWGVGKDRPESVRETLGESHDQLESLDSMLDGLWEHARSGRGRLKRRSVDLEACLDQAMDEIAALSSNSALRLTRGPLPRVRGDAMLLKNLLRHLISHALAQSGDSSPQLRIGVAESESDVFEVVDDGLQMSTEALDQLFRNLDASSDAQDSLSLFLARHVVEQHGGVIWAERSAGGGTALRFTLPLVPVRAAAAR